MPPLLGQRSSIEPCRLTPPPPRPEAPPPPHACQASFLCPPPPQAGWRYGSLWAPPHPQPPIALPQPHGLRPPRAGMELLSQRLSERLRDSVRQQQAQQAAAKAGGVAPGAAPAPPVGLASPVPSSAGGWPSSPPPQQKIVLPENLSCQSLQDRKLLSLVVPGRSCPAR